MLIADRQQYQEIVMERNYRLDAITEALGRDHIWTPELTQIERDNREYDTAMEEGNHPIKDEWQAIASELDWLDDWYRQKEYELESHDHRDGPEDSCMCWNLAR